MQLLYTIVATPGTAGLLKKIGAVYDPSAEVDMFMNDSSCKRSFLSHSKKLL